MRAFDRMMLRLRRLKHAAKPDITPPSPALPLREFVYLYEVSLRSLLSSQTGEMIDSTSEQSVDAREAEISATLGVNPGVLAKAELSSRFQTSDSSTLQTSRKATVQSWFRELHALPGLRLIEPAEPSAPAGDLGTLKSIDDTSLVVGASALRRGSLVEFRVKLKADPVFHLGTMVSEFSAMAEDFPEMFAAGNGLETLHQAQPMNKILQRLLAGLIPVRATAVDYSVVVMHDREYVVHNSLLGGLGIERKPLEIVCVTEHLAYWKDIRRVLFSEAEFILLDRVARDALDESWTPVKLADLFHEVAPDLVRQINEASRVPFGTPHLGVPAVSVESQLGDALRSYTLALLTESKKELAEPLRQAVDARIAILEKRTASISD